MSVNICLPYFISSGAYQTITGLTLSDFNSSSSGRSDSYQGPSFLDGCLIRGVYFGGKVATDEADAKYTICGILPRKLPSLDL